MGHVQEHLLPFTQRVGRSQIQHEGLDTWRKAMSESEVYVVVVGCVEVESP